MWELVQPVWELTRVLYLERRKCPWEGVAVQPWSHSASPPPTPVP